MCSAQFPYHCQIHTILRTQNLEPLGRLEMASFRFEEFDVANPHLFDSYIECLDCMFAARETTEGKKSPILLSVVGAATYQIARNLTSPGLPSAKTYEELTRLLAGYFKPKVNVVAQRFRFHKRMQTNSESCNAYMSSLRQLAAACDYGEFLDQALRDQFVCGLACDKVQGRCLATTNLTLEKAYDIASIMEGSKAGLDWMRPKPATSNAMEDTTVAKIYQGRARSTREKPHPRTSAGHVSGKSVCYHCRAPTHLANECPFKDKECHFCGKVGHIEKACLKKEKLKQKPSSVKHCVQANDAESSDDSLGMHRVSKIRQVCSPYTGKFKVNDQLVVFEIDTGAAETVLNRCTWEQCGSFELGKAPKLQTYTGEPIPTLGRGTVYLQAENAQDTAQMLDVIVVKSGSIANLLGRNAIEKLHVDLATFVKGDSASMNVIHSMEDEVSSICSDYSDVFQKGLGLLKGYQASLCLKEGTAPKFCKPRTIPFGVKAKVETELNRLTAEGVLERVDFSDWATPIVPIVKSDNSIRVCGDYKITLNPVLSVDQHPMPSNARHFRYFEWILLYFSKIDLSQAFNQIELSAESRKLTTINTPWGLYKYTRLCFGIANAPAIFQWCLDNVLQGIPGVVSRSGRHPGGHSHRRGSVGHVANCPAAFAEAQLTCPWRQVRVHETFN